MFILRFGCELEFPRVTLFFVLYCKNLVSLSEGRNDGSLDGVEYFKCRPKFGVFVKR